MSGTTKVLLIAAAVIVGLQVMGRWTGQAFSIDVLNPNEVGGAITRAQQQLSNMGGPH